MERKSLANFHEPGAGMKVRLEAVVQSLVWSFIRKLVPSMTIVSE